MKFYRSLFTLILLGFVATITFAADAGPSKFRPGELWSDDKGVPINAHGGGIVLHDVAYLFASGTSGWVPNPGRSAMADSIWGPWTVLGNPCRGTESENATTFESQSTYVLSVPGRPGAFIYMGDRWRPKNAIDGRYVWLPVEWENNRPVLRWHAEWDLSVFTRR